MGGRDDQVVRRAERGIDETPGPQQALGVLAFVAAGDRHDVPVDAGGEHPVRARPGVDARRHELRLDTGTDHPDALDREVEFGGGGRRRELGDRQQRIGRAGERRAELSLAAGARLDLVLVGEPVRDHVVHHGGDRQAGVGDRPWDRVERDGVQHQLGRQVPGARNGVVANDLRAPTPEIEPGDRIGQDLGLDVGSVERDDGCVDLDEAAEQAGHVAADAALSCRRVIDGTRVDEQRVDHPPTRRAALAQGLPDPDAAARRSSSTASCRSITWVAPMAVSASRRSRSE